MTLRQRVVIVVLTLTIALVGFALYGIMLDGLQDVLQKKGPEIRPL